ncbi:MAG TPA: ABC transporter ATP-binding protein [Burkholderiales bacterium]
MSSPEVLAAAGAGEGARAAIELEAVGLRYFTPDAEIEAVSGISLQVQAGEFVSLIGPSGCGKSSLLSLIAGIQAPTAGRILIDGREVTGPNPRVGYMLQQDYLFEWRSILDNCLLGAEIQGLPLGEARERALHLLSQCGLGEFARRYPRELSGGMRQRAALVRTLVTAPDVVLLDEPFSALDAQTRLAISDDIVDILKRERKTIVLVTHDIGEAISMTDRVVVLGRRPGHIKSEHRIHFAAGTGRPTPLQARAMPEFNAYFQALWKELDVHVED